MLKLIIVGAGGFGREVLGWALDIPVQKRDWEVKGFLDSNPKALDNFACQYTVIGDPLTYEIEEHDVFIAAIGQPGTKLKISRMLKERGARFITLVHHSSIIGPHCKIGEGSILCPGVVITTNATIGSFVALNVHSTVGHDAVIGDGCTISSHCDITGGARLGEGVFLGTHAAVLPNTVIGDYAVIGAGSVVLRKVQQYVTVMGVPAKQVAGFGDSAKTST